MGRREGGREGTSDRARPARERIERGKQRGKRIERMAQLAKEEGTDGPREGVKREKKDGIMLDSKWDSPNGVTIAFQITHG